MKLHGEGARLRTFWRPWVVKKYLAENLTPRLHIGCGGRNMDGWLNVDKYARNADTYLNAYERFPFADGAFAKAFSEHMVEHLDIDKVHHFLSEVYRVLRPGGVFRVTCPDLGLYAANYARDNQEFFAEVMKSIDGRRAKDPEGTWVVRGKGGAFMSCAVRNFHKHRWMYDYDTLSSCLKEVGFADTRQQSFQQSVDPELAAMDNPDRAFESLYIDAIKD
jgi:predicted SAM-dependent methyltransferase